MTGTNEPSLHPLAKPPRHGHDDAAADLLRNNGLRSTAQRLAILQLFRPGECALPDRAECSTLHLTAADIHDQLSHSGNHIDLSTIYRTITKLVNIGVLHAIAHRDQPVSYGLAAHAHHHAVCTGCGVVNDIPISRLAPMLVTVRESSGFHFSDLRITVHGLCDDCSGVNR